ncbi:MAG: dTMP kinase, partial [Treponemataceae bacterium]|nr:dTMP kinase [Treponemataceae bacterium]
MVLQNFIVFEGIDGAGTTTQIDLLKARDDAERFFFTAEPTNEPTGRLLRTMLRGDVTVDPRTAAYLFAADRAEHLWGAENGIAAQC